jgi:hypothetical protein
MSAHRTTRRAILAGAASLPAVTIGAGAALAAASEGCSFPDLVGRLLDARERMSVWENETSPAMSEEMDRRFFEETGITADEYHAVNPWNTKGKPAAYFDDWVAVGDIRRRIYHEVDPQENGESISFRAIRDPQLAIIDEILAKTPRNKADVLWQLEAARDGSGGDSFLEAFAAIFRAFAAGGLS